jgi:hypothetical protein
MTIVARLTINDFPLLVGDVLLSAPETPGRTVRVPTVGDITQVFPEGSGFMPSGLRQKIAVIGDNLVIGWSGSRIAAKTVIQELITRNKHEQFSNDSLMKHLNSLDETSGAQKVGFVGFIKDARGIAQFGFRYLDLQTASFGRMGLLGTGSGHFEEVIQSLTSFPQPSRPINDLERALGHGLICSGVLLSAEIVTRESLLHFFGGGYEVASLIKGQFKKLDNITYLFWHGEISANGIGVNLHQVCKYSYANDLLLIRAATLSAFSKESRLTIKQSIDVVPPIYRDAIAEELSSVPRPTFDSTWLCSYYLVPNPKGGIAVFAEVHYSVEGKAPIQFEEKEDHLLIAFDKDKLQRTLKTAFDSFDR